MNTVMVRNLEMGAGAPKVIVPIVAKTRKGILEKAAELKNYRMDLVEWRVDFFEDALDIGKPRFSSPSAPRWKAATKRSHLHITLR